MTSLAAGFTLHCIDLDNDTLAEGRGDVKNRNGSWDSRHPIMAALRSPLHSDRYASSASEIYLHRLIVVARRYGSADILYYVIVPIQRSHVICRHVISSARNLILSSRRKGSSPTRLSSIIPNSHVRRQKLCCLDAAGAAHPGSSPFRLIPRPR
jgi:hypothetical protein